MSDNRKEQLDALRAVRQRLEFDLAQPTSAADYADNLLRIEAVDRRIAAVAESEDFEDEIPPEGPACTCSEKNRDPHCPVGQLYGNHPVGARDMVIGALSLGSSRGES